VEKRIPPLRFENEKQKAALHYGVDSEVEASTRSFKPAANLSAELTLSFSRFFSSRANRLWSVTDHRRSFVFAS
jgi:hypothetical protein